VCFCNSEWYDLTKQFRKCKKEVIKSAEDVYGDIVVSFVTWNPVANHLSSFVIESVNAKLELRLEVKGSYQVW
jgi:hypothetical protein